MVRETLPTHRCSFLFLSVSLGEVQSVLRQHIDLCDRNPVFGCRARSVRGIMYLSVSSVLFLVSPLCCVMVFLWNDLVYVDVCQVQNSEVVSVKKDHRAVRVTWVSSFTLVILVLLLLSTGGVSASKLRSWRKYPDVNPWRIGNPSPRSSHTMVTGSDGALWSFGGELIGSSKSGELFKLDVQTEEWTTITTSGISPNARSGHTMGSTDGFLWVFGGGTISGEGEN
jgi:hypothetical protein